MKKLLSLILMSLLLVACSESQPEQVVLSGQTMGTTYTIKYLRKEHQALAPVEVKQEVDALLKEVNRQMSTYLPDSEITQFNRLTVGKMAISADFAYVLKEAIRLNELTQGALDITIGPVVNLWGFGPDKMVQVRPTAEQLQEAKAIVGVDKVALSLLSSDHTVLDNHVDSSEKNIHLSDKSVFQLSKTHPNTYIDLSSIAKGFGVDKVAEYLEQEGIVNYLVEIGGELRAKGHNAFQQVWTVGVEQPALVQGQGVKVIVPLNNLSMATSGNYRNFHIDEKGQRLSHIIDPETFEPIKHQLVSITVIHPSAMTADGLSTGLFVLGEERAWQLAEQENLAIFLIIKTPDGFRTKMSPAFQNLLN